MPEIRVLQPRSGAAVLECRGELDINDAPVLDVELEVLADANELVVADLSEAEFIDSSIIQCLLRAHRRSLDRKTRFRLQISTAPIVEKALEVSGVLEILDVAKTRSEALAPGTEG